jgi:hypothetical protein
MYSSNLVLGGLSLLEDGSSEAEPTSPDPAEAEACSVDTAEALIDPVELAALDCATAEAADDCVAKAAGEEAGSEEEAGDAWP